MLVISFEAHLKFLVQAYEAESRSRGLLPTARGGLSYIFERNTNALKVLGVFILRYVLAYFRYMQGTRCGCSRKMLQGRAILSELLYNMTTYWQLHYRDVVTRIKAPSSERFHHATGLFQGDIAHGHVGG